MAGRLDLGRLLETAGAHRAATLSAAGALVLIVGAALYLGFGPDDASEPPQQTDRTARRAPASRAGAGTAGRT